MRQGTTLWLLRLLVLAAAGGGPARADVQFEEVTGDAGLTYSGPSWGAAWGDVDGDGWPDAWIGHHAQPPALYLNNRDGTFTDTASAVIGETSGDAHGSAWADFDSDGDQDLLQLAGTSAVTGTGPNRLYVNQNGVLIESAESLGLDYPGGRGRTPLWLDWNGDGLLDVLVANAPRSSGDSPTAMFTQAGGAFVMDNGFTGLSTAVETTYAQLSHLALNDRPALLLQRLNFPERMYDYSETPFMDLLGKVAFPTVSWVRDSVAADFNGDLLLDLYLARLANRSGVGQPDAQAVYAALTADGEEYGISFATDGRLTVTVDESSDVSVSEIFLGRQGRSSGALQFTVSAASRGIEGLLPHKAGVTTGLYLGYLPAEDVWRMLVSNAGANVIVQSDQPITALEPLNFDNTQGAFQDRLFAQTAAGFQDVSSSAGLSEPSACESVAAADLDNDMDLDVYLVCRGSALNLPNQLLLNDGNANFTPLANAGGATGSTFGRGDTVALADFDRDGFVDILLTNGRGSSPFNTGPDQLFRNLGNGNNWVEIDLQGTQSNRDGIGALVYVTANGKTQLRMQGGGMRRAAQDHKRLHFGLASAQSIDSISVVWPNGDVQDLGGGPINTILTITQPMTSRKGHDRVRGRAIGAATDHR